MTRREGGGGGAGGKREEVTCKRRMEVLGRREDGSEGERIKMRKRKGLMRERQARGETKQYEQGSRQGEGQGGGVKFIFCTADAQYATNQVKLCNKVKNNEKTKTQFDNFKFPFPNALWHHPKRK
jgi:hypothetical protein